ncbi:MAG: xanthine dehydrogenase accessory factor [Planctomycetota bacterium]|jgi:xanthine dehydrogenase accessory factor
MKDVLVEISKQAASGKSVALASLVWSTGSIPMSDRAKMLVLEDGQLVGTIGGGCLEAEVYAAGREVLDTGVPCDMRYTMTEKRAGESGLNCGGTVRIYTELITPEMAAALFTRIVEARRLRQGCLLVSRLNSSERVLFGADGSVWGRNGQGGWDEWALAQREEVIARGSGRLCIHEGMETVGLGNEFFIEPFLPPPVLFVFGGGHVGGQVCALAKNVGFRVVLIDDRPAFANAERHPYADDCIAGDIADIFPTLPIDDQSYILALTRGHQYDELVVERAINTSARYIGMLGSERKKIVLWKRIVARGGCRERLDRVYAPIGANIGADTPEEIAVSVLAELVKVRRGVRKVWKTKREEMNA